jgi:hypothetical protein
LSHYRVTKEDFKSIYYLMLAKGRVVGYDSPPAKELG